VPIVTCDAIRASFQQLHESHRVPDSENITQVLELALEALKEENPLIRPRDAIRRPGGLVLLNPDITTVLVPDLHARTGYLLTLMNMKIDGIRVLERLLNGTVQVLCVGDGFHSEARGAERWLRAAEEYQSGYTIHQAIDEEMSEGISLMMMVMTLKNAFPERFHFLKGNHENVANAQSNGNRPFRKYAWEGMMVKEWFWKFLGPDLLEKWAEFEISLPILAVGDCFMVSHAEPRRAYTRERVIEYRSDSNLIFDFTWTGNNEAEEGSVNRMLEIYLGANGINALYFGGHRPVRDRYQLRAHGRYVQFHNPAQYNLVVLESGKLPNPDRDIKLLTND